MKKYKIKLALVLMLLADHAGFSMKSHAGIFGEATFDDVYKTLGKYIFLTPGKFAGTVAAHDMSTGKTLAWISLVNYGDTNPIIHHIAAFPSEDPYKGFEYIVNSQGGKNLYIYGLPTKVKTPGEGFHIYKIRYDGTKMNLIEDVAETTGLGLGVHVTSAPDAQKYAIGDGQKDILGIYQREPSKVIQAVFFDWIPNIKTNKEAWTGGGKLVIKKMHPDADGKYDYQGTKGVKIDWELVPGGELYIEDGKVSGSRQQNVCGLDALVWHPNGKYGVASLRTIGGGVIIDTNTWNPVGMVLSPTKVAGVYPLKQVDKETWEIEIDHVLSPAHQAGFSPDGKSFLIMNGVRENNIMVFDSSNPDPMKWTKKALVTQPHWRGAYPNTFHMGFTPDSKKVYVTLWWPSPTPNGVAVVDAVNWKVIKEIEVGPDAHTLGVTGDGRHVFGVISGYQKTTSGIYVIDVKTDTLKGFLPSGQGHHDCVIIPRNKEELLISRCPTT
jgi:hypothetical protein